MRWCVVCTSCISRTPTSNTWFDASCMYFVFIGRRFISKWSIASDVCHCIAAASLRVWNLITCVPNAECRSSPNRARSRANPFNIRRCRTCRMIRLIQRKRKKKIYEIERSTSTLSLQWAMRRVCVAICIAKFASRLVMMSLKSMPPQSTHTHTKYDKKKMRHKKNNNHV